MSPLSFLLVVGDLNESIIKDIRLGSIHGINIGNTILLAHLLFVDDTLLFSKGYKRNEKILQEISSNYIVAIRMDINFQNYTFCFNELNGCEQDFKIHFPFRTFDI